MLRWLLGSFVALCALAGWPAAGQAHEVPPCEDDADCEEGFVCYIGGCYAACASDADCVEGEEVCVDGVACSPTTEHLNEEAMARDDGGCRTAGGGAPPASGALWILVLLGGIGYRAWRTLRAPT